jgi:hypothetical protein
MPGSGIFWRRCSPTERRPCPVFLPSRLHRPEAPVHRLRSATWINDRTALGAGFFLVGALFLVAIATARIFMVKAPGPATGPAAAEPAPPTSLQQPQPTTSQPDSPPPSQLGPSPTGGSQPSLGRSGAMSKVVAR